MITTTQNVIRVPPEFKSLLPTVFVPATTTCLLEDVNVAIANGIRRALVSEVPVMTLYADKITCTDPHFALDDYILTRLRSIPIDQKINPGTKFKISVTNNTPLTQVVKSDAIVEVGGRSDKKYFDETFPLVELAPGKSLIVDTIRIIKGYEYTNGCFCACDGVTCESLDVEPINFYTGKGVSSSVSDPRKHQLKFNTAGNIDPKYLLGLAINEIIRRLGNINDMLGNTVSLGDEFATLIPGENDTTGNIIMKTVIDTIPSVAAITYMVDHTNHTMTLRLKATDISEANEIISKGIKAAIDILDRLKKQFSLG